MTFIDITYYNNCGNKDLIRAHWPNIGYLPCLPDDWKKVLIKFERRKGHVQLPGFHYYHFKGYDSKFWLPVRTNSFVARLKPDVVLLHGLIFPHQLMVLKAQLRKGVKIIVQHHAEKPGKGWMHTLQRQANRYIDAYLFSTKELAGPWITAGIIEKEKVFEVMEGSTDMRRIGKAEARRMLQLSDGPVFLWVGRLDNNKDPLTVLKGFERYVQLQPNAKLYMVYQSGDLLPAVSSLIYQSPALKQAVVLKGKMTKDQLELWYNAADHYISGSHSEGSGYALIEAMNAGCIPVVTDIPSFSKITNNGKAGLLFKPGNVDSLAEVLTQSQNISAEEMRAVIFSQFEKELSFEAIARDIAKVCDHLMAK